MPLIVSSSGFRRFFLAQRRAVSDLAQSTATQLIEL
jgi:hypothetical protein